jgi:pyrroline-5-carboxylate reductase
MMGHGWLTGGLVLLGCGKMGSALLAGWLAAGCPARSG